MSAARLPVASVRHTIIVLAILFGIAALGVYGQHAGAGRPVAEERGSAVPLYVSLIAAEWALLWYVLVGARKTGTSLRDLLGERWKGWPDIARDAAIAMAVWAAWTASASVVEGLFPNADADTRAITALLPRNPAEVAAWIALSLTAGFCEEVIYRGYLQRQAAAWTGSAPAAILIQAVIFGISHGYQGIRNATVITIYGALFGWLAWWRRSLKPGMILHAWTDVFGGIFGRSF